MDNRELCFPGDIAQTYNMPYVYKAQQAEHVMRLPWIPHDSLNKSTLNKKKFPAGLIGIFH